MSDAKEPERESVRDPERDPAAFERRRRGRNWAMFIVLLLLCLVFYAITWVKMTKS